MIYGHKHKKNLGQDLQNLIFELIIPVFESLGPLIIMRSIHKYRKRTLRQAPVPRANKIPATVKPLSRTTPANFMGMGRCGALIFFTHLDYAALLNLTEQNHNKHTI